MNESALADYMMHMICLGKLTTAQLVKEFHAFYGIPMFQCCFHCNLTVHLKERQSVVVTGTEALPGQGLCTVPWVDVTEGEKWRKIY
jgi:hypothetical protein